MERGRKNSSMKWYKKVEEVVLVVGVEILVQLKEALRAEAESWYEGF